MSKISENNIIEIKEIFKLLEGKKNLTKILKDIIKVADMVIEFKDYIDDELSNGVGAHITSSSDGDTSDSDYEPASFEEQLIGQSNSLTL